MSVSVRRSKGRRKVYSKKYGTILLDEFGSAYYAHEESDKAVTVAIALPFSLLDELDHRLFHIRTHPDIKVRKEGLSRSRYIRHLIEQDLSVRYAIE